MFVNLEYKDGFAVLTLNRPDALNAISFAVLAQLDSVLDDIEHSDARGLIVVGAGNKAFCAGADIRELNGRTLAAQKQDTLRGQATISRLARLKVPSVAVVQGYAFGGGLEIALACTFRIATATAKMGLPEIKLGLIPGYGGTQRLPRLIGEARALELMLSGGVLDASEALAAGLVSRVIDHGDLVGAGREFLLPLTQYSLTASRLIRESVARGMSASLEDGLRIEADLITLAFQSADANEGMQAFIEKRKADFKDR
ncbi:enoyl-CoA hydratase [Cupriavidus sp. UYMSc13B]|nr:enoyl-CoA hydratase [Cupriavidus sp. UYMSc13B]